MEIRSLSLENFKAHRDRSFEFRPGTNAICGENGAGKTSLLEAIAWVLFNYRGSYTKEDFIRNGAKSAKVRLRFISHLDGRTYDVTRCTTAGYSLYDPQLNEKLEYTRIEEEVLPWLRQHLGVPQGTDLARLFATTLGIPQGTFTADFLLTPEKRKPIFDAILKVEEYQQVYRETLALQRFAEAEVEKITAAIAAYEERLQGWEDLTTKRQTLQTQMAEVEAEFTTAQQRLTTLTAELAQLQDQADALQALNRHIEALETQIQTQTRLWEQAQHQLHGAEQAATLCQTHAEAYHAYLEAEANLQDLEVQRQNQIQLQTQQQKLALALSDRQAQLRGYDQELERLQQIQQDWQALVPKVLEFNELVQQQQSLQAQLQALQTQQMQWTQAQNHLQQLQQQKIGVQREIQSLEALKLRVDQIPDLEARLLRSQQILSRIEAATQFQAELQQLFDQVSGQLAAHLQQVETASQLLQQLQSAVPLWADPVQTALEALAQGQTLQQSVQTALAEILKDLASQTNGDELQRQVVQTQAQLREAQKLQAQYLTLDLKLQQQQQLEQDLLATEQTIQTLALQLQDEPAIQAQALEIADQLEALQNPPVQQQLLQSQLQKQPEIIAARETLAQSLQQDEAALLKLDQSLAALTTLTEQLQPQQQVRDQHRAGYQLYLQHQDRAQQVETLRQDLAAIADELSQHQTTLNTRQQERSALQAQYDLEAFQALQAEVQTTQAQQIRAQARLPEMQQRLEDLEAQVNQMQTLQTQSQAAQLELKQREKVKRFVVFARKVYKESGPRITARYITQVSQEADRLFRELINRPNVALEWTREYEILVREDAHTRRFINLSGGEQMCAALAVRLALLRVLSEMDIAFFDEPTTNMDRLRRQQLASAIANLRSFRQLFVISHDDTFEQVTENVILVEREA